MSKIKILIADDVEETRLLIMKLLAVHSDTYDIVAQAANGQEVLELIPKTQPDIVLMDVNMPIMNGLESAELIEARFPNVMVIIMSVQSEHEYLKKAMFIGAKDYIVKPFTTEQLTTSINETYKKYKYKSQTTPLTKPREAKTLAFFSTKGGVGKSVLASNLACFLSHQPDKTVLLWDLDLQFGDQGLLFDKQRSKTLTDLVDASAFDTYTDTLPYLEHISETLHVLCAPTSPEKAEFISKDIINQLLQIFKHHYDYMILDLGVNYDDLTLSALDFSDKVLFITTPDLLSLKNTKLGLKVMQSLNYEPSKVNVLINKFSNTYQIKPAAIEELLHFKVIAYIPEDSKAFIQSINLGQPILSNPKLKHHSLYTTLKKIEL